MCVCVCVWHCDDTVGGGHHAGATTKYAVADPLHSAGPPCKRPAAPAPAAAAAALFDDEHRFLSQLGVPSARLKMTTQGL